MTGFLERSLSLQYQNNFQKHTNSAPPWTMFCPVSTVQRPQDAGRPSRLEPNEQLAHTISVIDKMFCFSTPICKSFSVSFVGVALRWWCSTSRLLWVLSRSSFPSHRLRRVAAQAPSLFAVQNHVCLLHLPFFCLIFPIQFLLLSKNR